jgi:hypothetical protein
MLAIRWAGGTEGSLAALAASLVPEADHPAAAKAAGAQLLGHHHAVAAGLAVLLERAAAGVVGHELLDADARVLAVEPLRGVGDDVDRQHAGRGRVTDVRDGPARGPRRGLRGGVHGGRHDDDLARLRGRGELGCRTRERRGDGDLPGAPAAADRDGRGEGVRAERAG